MKFQTLFRCLPAVSAAVLLGLSAVCTAAADEDSETIFPGDSQAEQETYTSGDYTYTLLISAEDSANKAVCIESYTGDEHNLVIPGELDGMPVIQLGNYAFVNMPTLETVTIPKSVLAFGNFTFAQCTNLRAYTVEAGSEFCESRDGVLYTADGSALLRYPIGTSPQEITVPEGTVGIGNVAFSGSRTLRRVTLPDSLEYIGISAFSDCGSLNQVVIPSGVTEIPAYCFNLCRLLDTVTLPDTVTSIGMASFTGTALSEFTIPASCTSIGQQAFANTKLTQITIPATVQTIGYSAFGWKLNAYDELTMDDTFVIRGYAGSTAETYATDAENQNHFTFIDLTEQEQTGTTAPVAEPEPEKIGVGRIVGIAVCCIALVGIIAFAALSGRKKSAPEKEENTGDEE